MLNKETEIELVNERPSQRGQTLVAVGILGPGIARIRVSQRYVERSCESSAFFLADAHGVEVLA